MPIVERSTYSPPWFVSNRHAQTIIPSLLRRVRGVRYHRRRIETPDGDFLDLDYSVASSPRVAIVLHGLEGNSTRAYMLGMVKALNRGGWDCVALNFRGCSGEPNRTARAYHSGDTEDLDTVISHVLASGDYSVVALIGFSLGGNVVLKYVGERGLALSPLIRGAVTFSVPCDLASSAEQIAAPANRLYLKRFLRMLSEKIRAKMAVSPGIIEDHGLDQIKDFREFDDLYTAPLHGFTSAEDYWERSSSKQFLPSITVPTLLISAEDDPFLPEPCYPLDEARKHGALHLEIPSAGGHVGFVTFGESGEYWSESRAVTFLNHCLR